MASLGATMLAHTFNGGLLDTLNDLLLDSLMEFVHRLINFIPNVLVMFLIVLLGIILSACIRFSLQWLLGIIRFDAMAEKAGLTSILTNGGIKASPSRITVSVLYWGVVAVFFMLGFIALDVVPINNLVSEFLFYLPSVVASALILVLGFIFGNFSERAVHVAVANADIRNGDLVGKGVKYLIVVMAISMALDQLGIARGIIIAAFSISFGGIVFAVSLAFGLGAKDMAREFLEKRLKQKQQNHLNENESAEV